MPSTVPTTIVSDPLRGAVRVVTAVGQQDHASRTHRFFFLCFAERLKKYWTAKRWRLPLRSYTPLVFQKIYCPRGHELEHENDDHDAAEAKD